MTDKEFKELQEEIEDAWKKYDELQKLYHAETGKDYRWFR